MDPEAVLAALPELYEGGDVRAGAPRDARFAEVAQRVEGFTTPKVLALLNLAVRSLPPEEAYLEVGTFQGRSLCGALLDCPDGRAYAVENYTEFGMMGAQARAALERNTRPWSDTGRLTLLEGDAFEVLAEPGRLDRPVGVYFYDGAHTALTHYLALGVVEPLLADVALVLVDDAGWPVVRHATEQYLRRRPQWRVLHELRPVRDDDPAWANGLMLLEYRRPAGRRPGVPRDVAWRRALYDAVERPATSAAWRFVRDHPRLVPALKRVVSYRGRRVDAAA